MTLYGGFGKRDISPPPDGGGEMDLRVLNFWYDRAGRYGAIRDPLFARAAFFESCGEAACVVALDLIGDSVGLTSRIRDRIAGLVGLPGDRVMVVCTHAHATPETIALTDHPISRRWLDYAACEAAEAAREAASRLAPCRAAVVEGALTGVACNRAALREGWQERLDADARRRYSMLDETVRAAALLRPDGSLLGGIFSFACHPVCVQAQPFISADWPAAALRRLEGDCPTLFLNGACGDANPVRAKGYEAADWVGEQVAGKVGGLLADAAADCAGDTAIRVARRVVTLGRREVRQPEEIEREMRAVEARAAGAEPPAPGGRDNAIHERLFGLREERALARWPRRFRAEVQAMAIGPLLLVGLPAEVVACLGDDIRRAVPGARAWVIGYANGYLGYACPEASYEAGGYETEIGRWARLARGSGERLRDAAIGVAREAAGPAAKRGAARSRK